MIYYSDARLEHLSIHFIGSHADQEGIVCSEQELQLNNEHLQELMMRYFFDSFKEPEFYNLKFSTGEVEMNPMHQLASTLFDNPGAHHELSMQIAKYLYDNSKHPNIKSGDLIVASVEDVLIEDELVEALCIFKSENKEPFLTLDAKSQEYALESHEGIHISKLDKACIIFNTERSDGFKVIALDKSNRQKEAQFWISDFLSLAPRADNYYHTKNYIQATKNFVDDRVKPLYDIDKGDEAGVYQRSKEYLKNAESFDEQEYLQQTFQSEEVIQAFAEYKTDFEEEKNVKLRPQFDIHDAAVKNQSKVFKSVLKLDKNFHIYIHGDRTKIERGKEADGRKFYKVYYEEEK